MRAAFCRIGPDPALHPCQDVQKLKQSTHLNMAAPGALEFLRPLGPALSWGHMSLRIAQLSCLAPESLLLDAGHQLERKGEGEDTAKCKHMFCVRSIFEIQVF